DGQCGEGIVVEDGALAGGIGQRGVHGVRQVDGERLVVLVGGVAVDRHGDRAGGLSGNQGQGPGGRGVVGGGHRRAVGGREVHGDGLPAGGGQGYGEAGGGGPRVALGHRGVADGQRGRGVVVLDGPHTLAVRDGRTAGGPRQVDENGLVGLVHGVPHHRHAEGLRQRAR